MNTRHRLEGGNEKIKTWRHLCRAGLVVFYGLAGFSHLFWPAPFLSITPNWVPCASLVIPATGVCEIAGAVGLMVPRVRKYAGIALASYAVCVFPANIKHAIDGLSIAEPSVWAWAYHTARLPMQPVIVWLALFAGNALPGSVRRSSDPPKRKRGCTSKR